MKWIVVEDNVQADQYVPVMVVDRERKLNMERRPCAVFYTADEAMAYARKLRDALKARSIKLFYWEK
jgi:hypothetical protein